MSALFKLCQAWERKFSASELSLIEEKSVGKVRLTMSVFVEMELCSQFEMQRLLLAYTRIGPPSELDADKDFVSIEDAHRYLRVEQSGFTFEIFTTPAKIRRDYATWCASRKAKSLPAPPVKGGGGGNSATLAAGVKPTYAEAGMDKTVCVDFSSFCLAIWLLTHYEMGTLTFNMVDVDGSGSLDIDEVKTIVKQVYGSVGGEVNHKVNEKAEKVLAGLDVNGDKKVTKEEFVLMIKNFHYILFPAFVVQSSVRSKIFGHYIDWTEVENSVTNGKTSNFVAVIRAMEEKLNGPPVTPASPSSDFNLLTVTKGEDQKKMLDLNAGNSYEASLLKKEVKPDMKQSHSHTAGIAKYDAKIAPK